LAAFSPVGAKMTAVAAVMTGKGAGAIATIEVHGPSAQAIVKSVFEQAGSASFEQGNILLGRIISGSDTIDQVTVGCEGRYTLAIHCHGNPLIVEMIMELLQKNGVELVTAAQLLAQILAAETPLNTIAVEANLAQAKAVTLEGAKILTNQVEQGLNEKAQAWLENIDSVSLEEIKSGAERILKRSEPARYIMFGCTAVIVGPANSGKSTLLNCLAGRQKAIVTDIKGTTRDWVSARCRMGPLSVELIDTAGLNEELAVADSVDETSQKRTIEVLQSADILLLVLDNSQEQLSVSERLLEKLADKKALAVLNKCDLPAKFDKRKLPASLGEALEISAELATGIERLAERIGRLAGTDGFDPREAVCFTQRQRRLLEQLREAQDKNEAVSIITELLKGRLSV